MKCLILAAGYATRLYPLTENFPKPLLEVGEKTILDWLVDDIDSSGLVDEYIVISNHKFCLHFEAWAQKKTQKTFLFELDKYGKTYHNYSVIQNPLNEEVFYEQKKNLRTGHQCITPQRGGSSQF